MELLGRVMGPDADGNWWPAALGSDNGDEWYIPVGGSALKRASRARALHSSLGGGVAGAAQGGGGGGRGDKHSRARTC